MLLRMLVLLLAHRMLFAVAALVLFLHTEFCVAQESDEQTPEPFASLVKWGQVEFDFYDPNKVKHKFPGRADYHYGVNFGFVHHVTAQRRRGGTLLTIVPTVNKVEFNITHNVRVPESMRTNRWNRRLVRHEMDHVAISLDPRAKMLVTHLFGKLDVIRQKVPANQRIDEDYVNQVTAAELTNRRKAVTDLITANYRLLDKVSRHGQQPIPERAEFFGYLFTKPNLDEQKFAYTSDVLDLLRTKAYQAAELPYVVKDAKPSGTPKK